jgi:hypothetical protein
MNHKSAIQGKVLSIAAYKPKSGKKEDLLRLVAMHLPTLRKLGLATDKPAYMGKSTEESIIEVFEWVSGDAINVAHQHPTVTDIWKEMELVADFFPISSLPESAHPFSGFEVIS